MSKQFGDFSVISPNKRAWKVKNISVSAVSVLVTLVKIACDE